MTGRLDGKVAFTHTSLQHYLDNLQALAELHPPGRRGPA